MPVKRIGKALICGTLGLTIWTGSAMASKQCATPNDIVAIQSKSLQTELMVAALACNRMDRYNDFMHRYRGDLKKNGQVLRHYFQRSFGGHSRQRLDHFVTELANVASQKNNRGTDAFCQHAEVNFDRLLAGNKTDFVSYSSRHPLDGKLGVIPCQQ